MWDAGIGLAFWSVPLCQLPAGSPSPPTAGTSTHPCPPAPWPPAGRGGRGRPHWPPRAAEAGRLLWKAGLSPFLSRMLPSACVTPGIQYLRWWRFKQTNKQDSLLPSFFAPPPQSANPESTFRQPTGWARSKPSSRTFHHAPSFTSRGRRSQGLPQQVSVPSEV